MNVAKRLWFINSGAGISSDTVIVGLIIGQSNAAGRAEGNRLAGLTSYVSNPSGVKIYYKPLVTSPPLSNGTNVADSGTFDNYVVGTNSVEPNQETSLNCHNEIASIGPLIQSRLSRDVIFINAAIGGASLGANGSGVDYEPVLTKQEAYFTALIYFHRCIAELLEQGKKPKVFISWHQGEYDATDATMRANYQTNLSNFVTALRAQSPYLTTAPFIATQIYYATGANENTINTAISNYVAGADNAYVLNVATQVTYPRKQDLPAGVKATYPPTGTDDPHNSYEFQVKKGEMIYDKLDEIGFFDSSYTVNETYEYELERAIDRAASLSITTPDATGLTKINTLIRGLKDVNATLWKKLHGVLVFAQNGSADFGTINLKNEAMPLASIVGSPTWTSNVGVVFNGTSQYITSNFLFQTLIASTYYNNMFVAQLVHSISSKISFGLVATGSNNDFYMHQTPGSSSLRCWNSTAVAPISGYTTSTKFFALDRGSSTEYDYYIDGTRNNVAVSRVGGANVAVRFGYTGIIYGDETLSVGVWGEHLTETEMLALRTELVNYKSSL